MEWYIWLLVVFVMVAAALIVHNSRQYPIFFIWLLCFDLTTENTPLLSYWIYFIDTEAWRVNILKSWLNKSVSPVTAITYHKCVVLLSLEFISKFLQFVIMTSF